MLRSLLFCMLAVPGALAQLKIAAAADLQPVLPAVIEQFEKQTGSQVDAAYASSATLTTQILNGGPYSLFLAADPSFPQKVVAAGLADSASLFPTPGERWCFGQGTTPRYSHLPSTPCAIRC